MALPNLEDPDPPGLGRFLRSGEPTSRIHAKEIIGRPPAGWTEIIAKHTRSGPWRRSRKDTERDYFMSAEEAKGVPPWSTA